MSIKLSGLNSLNGWWYKKDAGSVTNGVPNVTTLEPLRPSRRHFLRHKTQNVLQTERTYATINDAYSFLV